MSNCQTNSQSERRLALSHSCCASNPRFSRLGYRHSLRCGDLRPGCKLLRHACSVVAGPHGVAPRPEMIRHLGMRGQEALGMPVRFESAHGTFSHSGGWVRVLRPVVQSSATMAGDSRQDPLLRTRVAGKLIAHNGIGRVAMTFEQLAEEAQRGASISSPLHQDIEHLCALVQGTPQINQLPVDLAESLIEVPGAPAPYSAGTHTGGVFRSKLERP